MIYMYGGCPETLSGPGEFLAYRSNKLVYPSPVHPHVKRGNKRHELAPLSRMTFLIWVLRTFSAIAAPKMQHLDGAATREVLRHH